MECVKGTLHVAVDTNLIFPRNYFAEYKSIFLKYILGENRTTDCIVACIKHDKEYTYELISIFSYGHDRPFIPVSNASDSFHGDLEARGRGASQTKMLNFDLMQTPFALGDFGIIYNCPHITNKEQADLVRLYRKARTAEYFDSVSAFLYYYHIFDYPYENKSDCAASFIAYFIEQKQPEHILDLIGMINGRRVFERGKDISTDKNSSLGSYIQQIRHSVGHIIRHSKYNTHNLNIDNINQDTHFTTLTRLMRDMARNKMEKFHGFNNQCGTDIFKVIG